MRFIQRFFPVSFPPISVSPQQWVQSLALLAALAGLVFWSSLLLTPAVSQTAAPRALAGPERENPAAQWFANVPAKVDIKVSGVMAGSRGAVAILSLNDGPPRSYRAGERVAQGVRLLAIEGDGVLIEHGSEQLHLAISKLPDLPFLPVLTRQPAAL